MRHQNLRLDRHRHFKKKTKAAVTGTFDPFTKGHLYLVEQALERFDIAHVVFLINPEKAVTFDLKKRMRFAELSTRHLGKRVMVSSYGGLTIDYCKRHGIKYIIRGYRNEKDLEYEKAMAEFNLNNGGVETIHDTRKRQQHKQHPCKGRDKGEQRISRAL